MKDKTIKYNLKTVSILSLLLLAITCTMNIVGCSKDVVTPREGAIQGKIVNLSGKPIVDALVEWEYDRTRWGITDKNGSYYIDSIGFGNQNFVVTANGYRSVIFQAPVYSGSTTTVKDVSIQGLSFTFSDITVTKTTATTANITWKTSDYTNSIIEYGLTKSLGKYARETENLFTTTHSMEVANLEPEKNYYFRISANRKGQSIESSNIFNFATVNSLEDNVAPNPPINVESALNGIAGQAVVFWTPNTEADLKGYKIYRSEVANGNFVEISNGFVARGQERYTDKNVIPGKKYFYHVTAIDIANNESGYNNVTEILIPGNVTSEVHWTLANSPYIVKGDINITEYGALYIDGGVKILVEDTDGLKSGFDDIIEINVSGAIIASAGNSLPITISSNKPNPSKATWKGISFNKVSTISNSLVNFIISDADIAISSDDSIGYYSNIEIINCNKGVEIKNSKEIQVENITTKRCPIGIELTNNTKVNVLSSTFVHPSVGIISNNNNDLTISGCNFLEYTDTGLISDDSNGNIDFTNNLFVSPTALGIKLNGKCKTIENSVFDTPYAIQIKSEVPLIQKNLFMAEVSIYGAGKKCIEYLGNLYTPEFGPNNVENFSDENAYIGCSPSIDSTKSSDIMLIKDIYGQKYDYRLRQPYPNNTDPWGIIRENIPYEE